MTNNQKIIFVVDDNNANLVACKEILKSKYVVYPVPSAEKMFDLLKHVMPDMILLDVEMPQMDGHEAAGKLKSSEVYRDIPVIFLTARNDAASETEGLNIGALDYIQKPFSGALLLRRMEMHLSLISCRKILEERNKTIEELTKAKSEFISRISREIRAPLNAVIGTPDIAMNSGDPAEVTNCMDKTDSAFRQILAAIDDILDESKTKSDR
jgi:putative two-component system response regulator